jgi:hypothetical protein
MHKNTNATVHKHHDTEELVFLVRERLTSLTAISRVINSSKVPAAESALSPTLGDS